MQLEIEAVYENGMLKPEHPLPLEEHERVVISVRSSESMIRKSAGLLKWTGDPETLEKLLGPDNVPWEKQ